MKSRALVLLIIGWLTMATAWAQTAAEFVEDNYNTQDKCLLVELSSNYLYRVCQGAMDFDSAILAVSKNYGLDPLLSYRKGYAKEERSEVSILMSKARRAEVDKLIATTTSPKEIVYLLDMSNYLVHRAGQDSVDLIDASRYANMALQNARESRNSLMESQSLLVMAEISYQQEKLAEAQTYFDQALIRNPDGNNSLSYARTLFSKAFQLPFSDPQRLPILQRAKELLERLGDKRDLILVKSEIIAQLFFSDFNAAERKLDELISEEEQDGFKHIHFVYDVKSFISDRQSNYVDAQKYIDLAIASAENTYDHFFYPIFYMRAGFTSQHLRENDKAADYFEKSLQEKSKQTQMFWYKSMVSLGLLRIIQLRPKEVFPLLETYAKYPPQNLQEEMALNYLTAYAYFDTGRRAEAAHYFEKLAALIEKIPPNHYFPELFDYYQVITKSYIKQGDFKKATYFREKLHSLPKGQSGPLGGYFLSDVDFMYDSMQGKYLSAIAHMLKAVRHNDSVMDISQRETIARTQIKFETEKKQQMIDNLQHSVMVTRIATICGVTVLILIVALIYYQYKIKRDANKQLELKQQEITRANENLQHLLSEKEWLLREVHHRVKNNLHTIVGLLESQSTNLEHGALKAVRDSKNRVYAMSLIHQKLYLNNNISAIRLDVYLSDLTYYLKESFNVGNKIHIKLTIPEIEIEVSQAIAVGLIINEAVTNSIKYAFPGGTGVIELNMFIEEERIILTIADNGIGIPQEQTVDSSKSLGLRLMKGVSEDIGGTLTIENKNGTIIRLTFIRNRNSFGHTSIAAVSSAPEQTL